MALREMRSWVITPLRRGPVFEESHRRYLPKSDDDIRPPLQMRDECVVLCTRAGACEEQIMVNQSPEDFVRLFG